jgi:hypothetical protein
MTVPIKQLLRVTYFNHILGWHVVRVLPRRMLTSSFSPLGSLVLDSVASCNMLPAVRQSKSPEKYTGSTLVESPFAKHRIEAPPAVTTEYLSQFRNRLKSNPKDLGGWSNRPLTHRPALPGQIRPTVLIAQPGPPGCGLASQLELRLWQQGAREITGNVQFFDLCGMK